MLNPHLAALTAYPFDRLRRLLDPIEPPPGLRAAGAVGGRAAAPAAAHGRRDPEPGGGGWGRYPPIDGTPEFREAVAGWLGRRLACRAGCCAGSTSSC